MVSVHIFFFFFQAEDGIRDFCLSRGLGDVYKRQVEVNGKTIREMGFLVDPEKDEIKYLNRVVKPAKKKIYLMLNKPAGCVSTCHDESGRKTVMQYVKDVKERLYPVGRLDFTTEGLLLMTNDGALTNALTHPRHNVSKKYLAVIDSEVTDEELEKLAKGVVLSLIHISEPTRQAEISYAVFCLKKKKTLIHISEPTRLGIYA